MKKIILILFVISIGINIYAETMTVKDQTFNVLFVKGKVTYEVSDNEWDLVTLDTLLTLTSKINTGINSILEIQLEEQTLKIKAMKKGTIEELIKLNKTGFSGIKLNGSLTKSNTNANDVQERTNIATASTRASDATKDIEWEKDEEENNLDVE